MKKKLVDDTEINFEPTTFGMTVLSTYQHATSLRVGILIHNTNGSLPYINLISDIDFDALRKFIGRFLYEERIKAFYCLPVAGSIFSLLKKSLI